MTRRGTLDRPGSAPDRIRPESRAVAEKLVLDLARVGKLLADLDKKLRDKAIRQALREGAKVVAAAVKARAPVETGRLKKSVKVRAGKRKRNEISMRIDVTGGHDGPFVGAIEFGTKDTPANPFVRGGFAATKIDAIGGVIRSIARAADEAGR
jgi:HK97 gp10 family phage protein